MVLPEGRPSPKSDRPAAPKLAAVGVALVALIGAMLALGQATAPPEELADASTSTTEIAPIIPPTTTTTIDLENFSATDIATGQRFFWVNAPPSGRLWPIDLLEHDGVIYLFGSERIDVDGGGRGASMWISADGVQWRSVGEVIPSTHTVSRVVSTGEGLVALGRDRDGAPMVWRSTDGESFQALARPTQAVPAGTVVQLNDALEFEGRLIVVGIQIPDRTRDVLAALPESLVGSDPTSVTLGFEVRDDVDDGVVDVFGPLGLHAFSMRMGELDLDPSLEAVLVGPDPPIRQFIWSTADGLDWQGTEVGSSIVEDLWLTPAGTLVAYGPGGRDSTVLTSADGETWERRGRSSRAWIFEIGALGVWREMMIGGGLGEDLFITDDGLTWERLGTGDLLPDSINWRLGPVAAGDVGLVSVARALRANRAPVFTAAEIDAGEATVTLDLDAGRLLVDHPGYQPLEMLLWTEYTDPPYQLDFNQRTVTFTDPQTGDVLATLGFATLESAENSAFTIETSNELALLYTRDGEEWSIQALTGVVSDGHEIDDILIVDDRVLILTRQTSLLGSSAPPQIAIVLGQITS